MAASRDDNGEMGALTDINMDSITQFISSEIADSNESDRQEDREREILEALFNMELIDYRIYVDGIFAVILHSLFTKIVPSIHNFFDNF